MIFNTKIKASSNLVSTASFLVINNGFKNKNIKFFESNRQRAKIACQNSGENI